MLRERLRTNQPSATIHPKRRSPPRLRGRLFVCGLALLLVGASAVSASADSQFYFGSSAPLPGPAYAYPSPNAYPYPYAYAYPRAYRYYGPVGPYPPACVNCAVVLRPRRARGHWAWRRDACGRRVRVWVPPHLR
jgi:hypothetical protein